MDYLDELENRSIYLIRESYARIKNLALLWSIGKDSTTMLWLAKKAFFGNIPFPVMHIDTGYKFKEIYDFREQYVKKWGLDLIVSKNTAAFGIAGPDKSKFECCNALKTEALKRTIQRFDLKGLLLAIRSDEHGIRAKERYFSQRGMDFNWNYKDQAAELWDFYKGQSEEGHIRIHPMLHWTECDIWRYVQREKIPIVSLYLSKNGKRYRSIGCSTCCDPVDSKARSVSAIVRELEKTRVAERSGRAQDKEDTYTMQRLRSLGYM
ncbi:MAG TPA: sulfate adenylyltransferase subunit CysD [Candidatus Omnitrophota bacterium]|nr:sulfate adenylyltransferase subunit CysD [Candidatus Omnitrophota bacterium]